MKISFDEEDAMLVAKAMAKSRGLGDMDFETPYAPGTTQDEIYTEALRVVVALRRKYERGYQ